MGDRLEADSSRRSCVPARRRHPDPSPTEATEPMQGQPALVVRALSSVQPEPIHRCSVGGYCFGKLAALAGLGGVGKSYRMHAIAACLTISTALPGGEQLAGPCDVLVASSEDEAADTIRPRRAALGANLDRVHPGGRRRHAAAVHRHGRGQPRHGGAPAS